LQAHTVYKTHERILCKIENIDDSTKFPDDYTGIHFAPNLQKEGNRHLSEDLEGQVILFQIKTHKKDETHKPTRNSVS